MHCAYSSQTPPLHQSWEMWISQDLPQLCHHSSWGYYEWNQSKGCHWPCPPTNINELQNFYRQFIHNYSAVAAPLTSLLRVKLKKLAWTNQAQETFDWLKQSFNNGTRTETPQSQYPVQGGCFHNASKLFPSAFYTWLRNGDIGLRVSNAPSK